MKTQMHSTKIHSVWQPTNRLGREVRSLELTYEEDTPIGKPATDCIKGRWKGPKYFSTAFPRGWELARAQTKGFVHRDKGT